MYTNYSPTQAKQLMEQDYLDTQDIQLLVCLPDGARHMYCAQSLTHQLHQSFQALPLSQLPVHLTEQTAGVLLLGEDVQLLSTALMRLAAALAEGADFVTADWAYGPDGQTECFSGGKAFRDGLRCAAVSRPLLERVLALAEEGASALDLIRAAAQAAQAPRHLPQTLFLTRREIQPGDLFPAEQRRALILCHEFSMTGAPIVLVNAIPVLKDLGFACAVLGPEYGPAAELFRNAGVPVAANREQLGNAALLGIALNCDLVLANTVCEMEAVERLSGTPVPVLWWLHDAFQNYPYIAQYIPRKLAPNVRVCAVGPHATAAMHSVRPDFQIDQLIYGLPDYARDTFPAYDLGYTGGKQLFVTVGSIERRKGQDVLCKAIELLPPDKLAKAAFLIVGKSLDAKLRAMVDALTASYPQNVFYRESLTRDEIKSLMGQCSCVICSSKDDPMPTFVTEGLIFGRPPIVSEFTGTAGLIQEGVDGFVYRHNDPKQLAGRIEWMIDHPELSGQMSAACRALYERLFTYQSFAATLERLVEEVTRPAH